MPVTWDFFNQHVQSGLPHGQFISGRSIVLGAGPPNILSFGLAAGGEKVGGESQGTGELVYLIGVLNQVSIAYSLAQTRLFEIGSERQYFITGRAIPMITLGRILYHGPNLLRVLYAYYRSNSANANIPALLKRYNDDKLKLGVNKHTVKVNPGDRNFFLALASDLFSQPIGLLLIIRDQNELNYAMAYAEHCYIDNWSIAWDSHGILVMESSTVSPERIVPVSTALTEMVELVDETVARSVADAGSISSTPITS